MIRTRVADGDRGTAQTIPYAKQLIAEGMVDAGVRNLAVSYCSGVPSNDELAEMQAIFNGVLRDFRYIKDPVGTQLLQPAPGVLKTRAGNCATLNLVLLPSLLGSVGYPTRAVTIKADMDRPKEFSHVDIEAQSSDGRWIPLDVARSNPVFGKEPEYYWARKNWPLTFGASAGAGFLQGYGGLAMRRGIGSQPVMIMRKSRFPRGPASFFSHPVQVPLPASGGPIKCGMGQNEEDDTAILAAATPSILTGVAQVVKAANTPGIAVSGVTTNATSVQTASSSGLLLILALAGVAALVMSRH